MQARETLVSSDDTTRRLVYAIIGQRFAHYSASVQVFADGEHRSRVEWIIDLFPNDLAEFVRATSGQGARVMREYWQKPKHTADALKNGWYHTGDMGSIDSAGRLFVVDRKKDMIISGGENVYSVEVENAVSQHPAVFEVAAIGVPDAQWGEAVKVIVVLREGASATAEDIIAFCRGKVASYKIPKSVDFSREQLPKTGPGKIAKRRLRDPFWVGRERKI